MRWSLFPVLLLATLATGGCRGRGGPVQLTPSATAPAPAAAPTSPAPAVRAPFELVDLFDLQRRGVSRFAYCPSTEELFVSFDPGEALQRWSVPGARLLHSYPVEGGFMVDTLFPSPDGRALVLGLYRVKEGASASFEKYALLDLVGHRFVSLDLGIHDDRFVRAEFGAGGQRFRLWAGRSGGGEGRGHVYDPAGRETSAAAGDFPPQERSRLRVVESSKDTLSTHGLYYTDAEGLEHLVTQGHWHDNYALTRDGQYVVSTTWDGEVLAWSTVSKAVVFTRKIAEAYGYLAYDEKHDRFLLADATSTGTSHLRALVRAAASAPAP
jgi:WD40 repeat protein